MSVAASSSPDELLAQLDPEQREVATTLTGPVVVIAGAGTGKTRAITHRIAYGVAIGAYNPASVLAVTFTTRAAGELRGRLQQLGAYGIQARTFHSAALRQAQYFWPRIYGGELSRKAHSELLPENLMGDTDPTYTLDPAKAEELIAESGVETPIPITMAHFQDAPGPEIAASVKENLDAIGFDVTLTVRSGSGQSATQARTLSLARAGCGT